MSVRWKTKHRLLEHFAVKYSSRSQQRSWWTKVDGHHDDLKKKIILTTKKDLFHPNVTFAKYLLVD
jgi:hypothetical protein